MDVFSWSMPFLAEKVTTMLFNIVKKGSGMEDIPNSALSDDAKKQKLMQIKGKVKTIGRMTKMFTTLREESETLLKIKNVAPDGKLPRGLLLDGKPAIKNALK